MMLVETQTVRANWLAALLSFGRRAARSEGLKRVAKNAFALSAMQFAGYGLPLVLLPYATRVLGPERFGTIGIVQALVAYSALVTNYGFSLSGTRRVAIIREDREALSEAVVSIWTAKGLLAFACFLLSCFAWVVFSSLRVYTRAYGCGFLGIVGCVFSPEWYFQGIEQMKWLTMITLAPRIALLPLIFVFVHHPADYWKYLLIHALTSVASGFLGAVLVRRSLSAPLPRPRWDKIWNQLQEGWATFLSTVSITAYTSTNTLLLAAFTNQKVVGYYTAGAKIVMALLAMWNPFAQALYPYFCRSFHLGGECITRRLRQLLIIVGSLTLAGCIMGSILAPVLIPRYLGPQYAQSTVIIQILIFVVFASTTTNILGTQGLLGAGLNREFLIVVTGAAVLNLLITVPAILTAGSVGLAVTTVILEIVIAAAEARVLHAKGIL